MFTRLALEHYVSDHGRSRPRRHTLGGQRPSDHGISWHWNRTTTQLPEDLGMKSYRVNISDAVRVEDLAVLPKEGKARGISILPVITPQH